jgi:hypothetical protein
VRDQFRDKRENLKLLHTLAANQTRGAPNSKIRRVSQFSLNQLTARTAAVDGRIQRVDTPVRLDQNVNDKYQQGKNSK